MVNGVFTTKNYTVISTDPEAEGGDNFLNIKAECEVWVRIPLRVNVENVEVHPVTLMEFIKGNPRDKENSSLLDPPLERIEEALKEDISKLANSGELGEYIDYKRLNQKTEEGTYIEDYIYGNPEVTNLTIQITD